MFQKKGFVDNNLIKIKDKLSEASSSKLGARTEHSVLENGGMSPHTPSNEPTVNPSLSRLSATPQKVSDLRMETLAAIKIRRDEFRLLKRDLCGKLSEKLSSFPEDIKITERRLEELKNAIEKFASFLDELKITDEDTWSADTSQSDIGKACRKAEHIRLEYIRICAKLFALQRESSAAEMELVSRNSLIPELSSISLNQGFKIGLFLFLPVIVTILLAAIMLCLAYIIALKI